jgi:hypothetical protein
MQSGFQAKAPETDRERRLESGLGLREAALLLLAMKRRFRSLRADDAGIDAN